MAIRARKRKRLSKDDKLAHVEGGGGICPYCESSNISSGNYDGGGGTNCVTQWVCCLDCEREWTDIYTLTSIEEVA